MQLVDSGLDGPILFGDPVMLAQMLEPARDDEGFDEQMMVGNIAPVAPAHCSVPQADRAEQVKPRQKFAALGRVDLIFDGDEHWAVIVVDRQGRVRWQHMAYKPGDEAKYIEQVRAVLREKS